MADITNILAMGPQPTTAWKSPLEIQAQQAALSHTRAATEAANVQTAQMQAEMERERRNIEAAKRAAAESSTDHGKYIQLLEAYGASPEIVNQTRNSIGGFMQSLQAAKDHELALHEKQNTRAANIIDSVMAIQDAQRRPVEYKRAQSQAALEGVTLPDWVSADALDIYRHGLGVEGAMAEAERLRRAQDIQQQQADATTQNADTSAQRAREAIRQNLRKAGLRENPETGEVEEIPYEEMTPAERASIDDKRAVTELRQAQAEAAQAKAEYDKARASGNSEQMELARQRLAISAQNAKTAVTRLGLSQDQFEFRTFGTVDGKAPAGTLLDDNGTPIGSINAQNVRPTGASRTAAERADTLESLDKKIRIALQNPELRKGVGPLAGRLKELENRMGTLPRDLAELKNDLVSYGAFQAGLHPVRGIGAMQYFDQVLGGLGQSPEELLGKMDSNLATAKEVQKVGTPKTVGGKPEQKKPQFRYNPKIGALEPVQ